MENREYGRIINKEFELSLGRFKWRYVMNSKETEVCAELDCPETSERYFMKAVEKALMTGIKPQRMENIIKKFVSGVDHGNA